MTPIRTETSTPTVPRDLLIADAVVSAYLAEISGVWRSDDGAPDDAPAEPDAM
jgi:hypothetical protein